MLFDSIKLSISRVESSVFMLHPVLSTDLASSGISGVWGLALSSNSSAKDGSKAKQRSASRKALSSNRFPLLQQHPKPITMSGRGRGGRGRGYTPPTGAQLFLQRSAQECGLDSRNLRTLQDITRPLLYPDLRWHSNGSVHHPIDVGAVDEQVVQTSDVKRTASSRYLIMKGRAMHQRIQNSEFYVRPTLETDVVRFRGKRPRTTHRSEDQAVLEKIRNVGPSHIPQELMSLSALLSKQEQFDAAVEEKKDAKLSLAELAARERQDTGEIGEGEDDGLILSADEEEEDGEDYVMNHYDSDDDNSDGGGDGEPTF